MSQPIIDQYIAFDDAAIRRERRKFGRFARHAAPRTHTVRFAADDIGSVVADDVTQCLDTAVTGCQGVPGNCGKCRYLVKLAVEPAGAYRRGDTIQANCLLLQVTRE